MQSARLPQELLQYAENFYRRFPEEFLALGAPGLEENFDLRPNGTWTRQLVDTPSEKSVEITIRRWQHPPPPFGGQHPYFAATTPYPPPQVSSFNYLPMAGSAQHLAAIGVLQQQASGFSASSTAAGPPPYGYPPLNSIGPQVPTAPIQSAPPLRSEADIAAEAKLTSRLSQMEAVLTQLKPQIEGILSAQQQAAQAPVPATNEAHRSSRGAGSSADTPMQLVHDVVDQQQPSGNIGADGKELRNRRGVDTLAIVTARKEKAPEKVVEPFPKPIASPQQNLAPRQGSKVAEEEVSKSSLGVNSIDRGRPQTNINPVRVASGHQDPASPRSPGRFSVWK